MVSDDILWQTLRGSGGYIICHHKKACIYDFQPGENKDNILTIKQHINDIDICSVWKGIGVGDVMSHCSIPLSALADHRLKHILTTVERRGLVVEC